MLGFRRLRCVDLHGDLVYWINGRERDEYMLGC